MSDRSPQHDASLAERLRALPAVDRVIARLGPEVGGAGPGASAVARQLLDELREQIRAGDTPLLEADPAVLAAEVARRLLSGSELGYPRVVNATGVLLHTGLGRAPLAGAAARALAEIADGYVQLEVDREDGERRHREAPLAAALRELVGAQAATVVNNNAAALLLVLRAMAADRDVVVSRGELIEIGGGFRLPELMQLSGAKLVEVGTTNRTYASDYEAALGPDTGLLLSVHTSNYRVVGFQHSPKRAELVALARRHGVPLAEDVGSGLLVPGRGPTEGEPDVKGALAEGVDLVLFSGDKLLGGPQAGIIVGRQDLVAMCRRDPLFRAVRPDRLALVALATTLQLHRDAPGEIPVVAALSEAPRARLERARHLAERLAARFGDARFEATVTDARVGSGSSPGREVRSAAVELSWPGLDAATLAARLRLGTPAVFGREWRSRYRLDMLALRPGDEDRIELALAALTNPDETPS